MPEDPPDLTDAQWQLFVALWDELADLAPDDRARLIVERTAGDALLAHALTRKLALSDVLEEVASSVDEDLRGQLFDQFRLERRIAAGGQGVVYLARRDRLGTAAAVKVLLDPAMADRFFVEQRALSSLGHAGIARFYTHGEASGYSYFALEYVDGKAIVEHCAEHALPLAARLSLVRALCDAVQHAHARGVVHCDIKPSNVLVEKPSPEHKHGAPRLVDFGIAVILPSADERAHGQAVHAPGYTLEYASPEQLRSDPVAVTHDVYSLGVLIYELLALRHPFIDPREPAPSASELTRRIQESAPLPLGAAAAQMSAASVLGAVSAARFADLEALVAKAMAKTAAERYASVAELLDDLERFERNEPLQARSGAGAIYLGRKALYRNRGALLAITLVIIAVVATTAYHIRDLTAARDRATAEAKRAASEAARAEQERGRAVVEAERAAAEALRAGRVQQFMLELMSGGAVASEIRHDLTVKQLLGAALDRAGKLDADPSLQAELLYNVGRSLLELGDAATAAQTLARARDRHSTLAGAQSAEVARDLAALADARFTLGERADGEGLARQALALARNHAAREPELLASSAAVLGHILDETSRYDEAIRELTAAKDLLQKTSSSPDSLSILISELAGAHYYKGNYKVSEELNLQSLDLDTALYGPSHPRVAHSLINLAMCAIDRGAYDEAVELDERAVGIMRAFHGSTHPETAAALTQLGRALMNAKRYDEAEDKALEALAIDEAIYPEVHARIASTLHDLYSITSMQDRIPESEKYAVRVLGIERALNPKPHPRVGHALDRMGSLLLDKKDPAGAERMFREALSIYEVTLPAEHMSIAIAHAKIGRALLHQKRYATAEPETRIGHDYFAAAQPQNPAWLKPMKRDLLAICEGLGKRDDVARYKAELAALDVP